MPFRLAIALATPLTTQRDRPKRDTETLGGKSPKLTGRGARGFVSPAQRAPTAETRRLPQVVAENGLKTRNAKAAGPWLSVITCGYRDFDTRISVAGTGFESVPVTGCSANDLGNLAQQRGAESGAVAATAPADADMALLVQCWKDLPEPLRAGIVAMVRSASADSDQPGR